MNEDESSHLVLLLYELPPTVVLYEEEEQQHPDSERGNPCNRYPFPEPYAELMLYAQTYDVVVEDEEPVNEAELIGDG